MLILLPVFAVNQLRVVCFLFIDRSTYLIKLLDYMKPILYVSFSIIIALFFFSCKGNDEIETDPATAFIGTQWSCYQCYTTINDLEICTKHSLYFSSQKGVWISFSFIDSTGAPSGGSTNSAFTYKIVDNEIYIYTETGKKYIGIISNNTSFSLYNGDTQQKIGDFSKKIE